MLNFLEIFTPILAPTTLAISAVGITENTTAPAQAFPRKANNACSATINVIVGNSSFVVSFLKHFKAVANKTAPPIPIAALYIKRKVHSIGSVGRYSATFISRYRKCDCYNLPLKLVPQIQTRQLEHKFQIEGWCRRTLIRKEIPRGDYAPTDIRQLLLQPLFILRTGTYGY